MIKPTYYTKDYERYVTPIYCDRDVNLLYLSFGTTKYESMYRAEFIQKALDAAKELDDFNMGLYDDRNRA